MPRAALLIAALAVFALAACDAAPGLPAEVRRPSLTAFRLTPTTDSLATRALTATIPLVLDATIVGEGPVVVRAVVRYAEAPSVTEVDTLVADVRVEAEPGPVRVVLPITVSRGATGDYAVTLTTEGADGREGDGAAGVFRFRAASLGPPVVARVENAAVVVRPTGARPVSFPIVATVTDPDGRANVAAVVLADTDGNLVGQLYDQGSGGGASDATPGDGRYSAALQIFPAGSPNALPAGRYDFVIVAFDRAGGQSAAVPFRFEIR